MRAVVTRVKEAAVSIDGAVTGEIKEGFLADVAIIDPQISYVYDEALNKSKSRNSPLFGKQLTGAAVCTIKSGRVVYEFPNVVA